MNNKINYFNEALLLATRICNWEEKTDSDLPIDYKKYGLSKEQLNLEYQDLVTFYGNTRREARRILNDFEELEILFKNYKSEKTPEILYFLTYSKLKETIQDYSVEDLLSVLQSEFIKNMDSLGYELSQEFSFQEIDRLNIFNEQQRYLIYKLVHNINKVFEQLYQFISLLEKIIQDAEILIGERLGRIYQDLKNKKLLDKEMEATLSSLKESHSLATIEYTIFIQFPQRFGFSLFLKNELVNGFCYFGLAPCLLEGKPKSVEEKKEDMIQKLSLISDPTRFNIILLLSKESMYGREVAEALSISTGTISHHLSNLLKVNLIQSEMKGKRIYYSVNQSEIRQLGRLLLNLGGENDE